MTDTYERSMKIKSNTLVGIPNCFLKQTIGVKKQYHTYYVEDRGHMENLLKSITF